MTSERVTDVPSIEIAVEKLMQITGDESLTSSSVLLDADVDSIDFVEWTVALGLGDVDLDDGVMYELLEEGTVADLYGAIVKAAGAL